MDKIFKIPPPPGKTGDASLRPLEENTLSPVASISQPRSVCFSALVSWGEAVVKFQGMENFFSLEMLFAVFLRILS